MARSGSTHGASLARKIVRSALGDHPGSAHTVPVLLPRRDQPVYVMPTSHAQPWGLLPMKAAAYKQYPNIFNTACLFFSSINRDVGLRRPAVIARCSAVAIDLAKVLRNLGIIGSFEVGQKVGKLKNDDYLWDTQMEPDHISDLKLYKYKFMKLNLRWNLYKPVWQSSSASLAQTPLSVPEAIPLSVKNISRASQPVLMSPSELNAALETRGPGIFIVYNHETGLTTDAMAQLLQLPSLVLVHLGLPFSHVAQIQAAMKAKLAAEQGIQPEQRKQLKDWSMIDFVHDSLEERAEATGRGQVVQRQRAELQRQLKNSMNEDAAALSDFDVSSTLSKELLAWQLKDKLSATQAAGLSRGGSGAGNDRGAARGGGAGGGSSALGAAGPTRGGEMMAERPEPGRRAAFTGLGAVDS